MSSFTYVEQAATVNLQPEEILLLGRLMGSLGLVKATKAVLVCEKHNAKIKLVQLQYFNKKESTCTNSEKPLLENYSATV